MSTQQLLKGSKDTEISLNLALENYTKGGQLVDNVCSDLSFLVGHFMVNRKMVLILFFPKHCGIVVVSKKKMFPEQRDAGSFTTMLSRAVAAGEQTIEKLVVTFTKVPIFFQNGGTLSKILVPALWTESWGKINPVKIVNNLIRKSQKFNAQPLRSMQVDSLTLTLLEQVIGGSSDGRSTKKNEATTGHRRAADKFAVLTGASEKMYQHCNLIEERKWVIMKALANTKGFMGHTISPRELIDKLEALRTEFCLSENDYGLMCAIVIQNPFFCIGKHVQCEGKVPLEKVSVDIDFYMGRFKWKIGQDENISSLDEFLKFAYEDLYRLIPMEAQGSTLEDSAKITRVKSVTGLSSREAKMYFRLPYFGHSDTANYILFKPPRHCAESVVNDLEKTIIKVIKWMADNSNHLINKSQNAVNMITGVNANKISTSGGPIALLLSIAAYLWENPMQLDVLCYGYGYKKHMPIQLATTGTKEILKRILECGKGYAFAYMPKVFSSSKIGKITDAHSFIGVGTTYRVDKVDGTSLIPVDTLTKDHASVPTMFESMGSGSMVNPDTDTDTDEEFSNEDDDDDAYYC